MIERWRTTITVVYIAVLWSCICCDNVCFANGFKSLVTGYFGVHRLANSSCPIEVSLQFDRGLSHKISLSGATTLSNSTRRQSSSSGNCTNNLTAADSLRKPPSTFATDAVENGSSGQKTAEGAHQPIATFDEWTKEKLKQEQQKKVLPPPPISETGVPSVGSQRLPPGAAATRNYASKECGAKVLLSNPEAENTKAILNEKEKDEYMRNPCEKAENKFVIIELCETVQPRSIELANYELFSSGPREIRLWSAERFPTGEWQLLTELTAVDSRQSQQYPISSNGAYVKFIKVELLSHYGNEHYCTLSVLKILGISMVDEYEAEAEAASVVHARGNVASSSGTEPNSTLTEGTGSADVTIAATADTASTRPTETQENDTPVKGTKSTAAKEEAFESKPTVIEIVDEVSGHLIRKFVDAMKDNFGVKKTNSRHSREYIVSSTFMACYFCPKDGTYIYPRQFCQAFLWKSSPPPLMKRDETRSSEAALFARRRLSSTSRNRRSRFAFLQRRSLQQLRQTTSDSKQNLTLVHEENSKAQGSQPSKIYEANLRAVLLKCRSGILGMDGPIEIRPKVQVTHNVHPKTPTPQIVHSDAWPASSTSHKESVFMKLNKRIAALELNMSLSSEYLSELSRQYVAQTDEHQKHMKQTKKVVDEAVQTIYARVNETLADKIALLRKEVDTLSDWLSSMRATASKMTVGRFIKGAERIHDEKCIPQQTDLHRYSPPDDGLWTTEQVVYMVISTQLFTVLILVMLSFCYQQFVSHQQLSEDQRIQVEELINERVFEALEKNCSILQLYDKEKLIRTKHRTAHVEEMDSMRSDERASFSAECSSSSPTTNSDESSTEELPMAGSILLPSELRAISSVALLT